MQIKHLRISGFKSFADSVEIPILQGLTGVVGPNGCGKSNILEALRWVMGASSARSLRAPTMGNIIFAGSQKRPARNWCEVALVIENVPNEATSIQQDGAHSTEIEISRRARKSKNGAESLFRLNGAPKRARDIRFFLADARLGAQSCAFVRQGHISEIIDSTAEKRGHLLSEAAGVTGVNARRHEAVQKLASTRRNLELLEERATHFAERKNSLTRQKEEATHYRALSEEIARTERTLLSMALQEAEKTLKNAGIAWREASGELELGEKSAQNALLRYRRQREVVEPLYQQAEEAALEEQNRRDALERAIADLQSSEEKEQNLGAALAENKKDIERETASLGTAQANLERIEARLRTLRQTSATDTARLQCKEVFAAAQAALQKAEETSANAETAFNRRRLEAALHEREHAALSEAQRRTQAQQNSPDDTKERIAQVEQLAGEKETLAKKFDHARQIRAKLDSALSAALRERNDLEWRRREKMQARQKLLASLAALDKQEDIFTDFLRSSDDARIMQALKIAPGWEKALLTLLDTDAQAGLVRADARFWVVAPPAAPLPAFAEDLPRLADYVEAPPFLHKALASVAIVENEAQGWALFSGLLPGQKLVTKEGMCWRWDGFFAQHPSAGMRTRFTYLQKRDALQAERQSLLQQLKALDSEKKDGLARLEDKIAQLEGAKKNIDLESMQTRLHACDKLLAAKQASLQRHKDQTAFLLAELDRLAAEIALLEKKSRNDPAQMQVLAAEREKALARLADKRQVFFEARLALRRAEDKHTAAQEATGLLMEEKEQWQKTLHTSQTAHILHKERQKHNEKALHLCVVAKTGLAKQIEMLRAAVETKEKKAALARSRRDIAAQDLRLGEEARDRAQATLMNAREAQVQRRALFDHARQRLSAVEERIDLEGHAPEELRAMEASGTTAPVQAKKKELRRSLVKARAARAQLGAINLQAAQELDTLLAEQGDVAAHIEDACLAATKLEQAITMLGQVTSERLARAFSQINQHFISLFTTLFQGGSASLHNIAPTDPESVEPGLDITAAPPGKKTGGLSLLSGGEQTLTALALLFAVFLVNPAPLCVLDEVDAALDETNVGRFCRLLSAIQQRTQTRFLVISHHPHTIAHMDRLFGVTMPEPGVSQLVSVDLDEASTLIKTG